MERKFRGKRKKNGEWAYGVPFVDGVGRTVILCLDAHGEEHRFEVDPATVGQFTGATDEKGVEIYEGDRVLVPSGVETVCRWSYHCGFSLFGKETHQTYAVRFKDSSSGVSRKPLVVGTIHDSFEAIAVAREGESNAEA